MTNQTPESVIAEVLDEERYYDRDQISNESRAAEIVAALRAANMLRDDAWLTEYTRVKQAEAWERNSEETEVGGACSCCGITEVHRPQNPYREGSET